MADRIRHFLVERDERGLRQVSVFDDGEQALERYAAAERSSVECVLLGADRLSTALHTHSSWFDEPSADELLITGELRTSRPPRAGRSRPAASGDQA